MQNNVVVDQESGSRHDELDAKYSSLYEDSVNPFVVFNRKVAITCMWGSDGILYYRRGIEDTQS